MLSLLGVALSHGLLTESKTFLRLFLTALICPSRDRVPSAIAHPMYPSYLVELCEEWTRLAPAAAFTRRTFAAITLEILVEQGPRQAWTCKSVTRLAQLFRTQDFGCFLSFLHGLIEAIIKWPRYEHDQDPVEDHSVFSRFAKWTGVITSDFFAIGDDNSASDSDAEQFHSIVEILVSAFEAGIHMQLPTDDCNHQAALVCAATLCLSAHLFTQISVQKQNALLALLRDATPDSTTFSSIVAHRPLAHHLHAIPGHHLRLHDLGALEVALWTCAVEHAEPAGNTALTDALSDAERRFYMCKENAGEWEWEDMVGSWVRRVSPPPRKTRSARRETVPGRAKRRRLVSPPSSSSSTTTSRSTSVFTECTPSLLTATPSPSSTSSFSTPPTPSKSPFSVVVPRYTKSNGGFSARATRNTAKLRSVLADALRMRIDLKTERRNSSRALSHSCSGWSERGEDHAPDEEIQAATIPSEGDVLDMFTYNDDDPL
jgi:hypothetical protein